MLGALEQMIGPHPLSRTLYPAGFLAQLFLVSKIALLSRYSRGSKYDDEVKSIPRVCNVSCAHVTRAHLNAKQPTCRSARVSIGRFAQLKRC